ncbi:hypothetical protein GBAR_LOCUS27743 [Geodia barretti]|uniref:PID domain-containing protein n=1 Tax=Geodia barretti TaxID=519541 RepID=A0AA35TLU5_GEOBA|nr:hypothetical protein GBAR_LOCUS27743 [Geodia barretti]
MASSQGASQLFQVLYLGSTRVDRHCSHTIMPWIAEELKLRTEQKIFTWLNPGENGVSYVANTGVELFHHAYSTILRCATGVDGITFAYIIREEDGSRYTCHVFQCLTPEEV